MPDNRDVDFWMQMSARCHVISDPQLQILMAKQRSLTLFGSSSSLRRWLSSLPLTVNSHTEQNTRSHSSAFRPCWSNMHLGLFQQILNKATILLQDEILTLCSRCRHRREAAGSRQHLPHVLYVTLCSSTIASHASSRWRSNIPMTKQLRRFKLQKMNLPNVCSCATMLLRILEGDFGLWIIGVLFT